jgi:hypothetical protein
MTAVEEVGKTVDVDIDDVGDVGDVEDVGSKDEEVGGTEDDAGADELEVEEAEATIATGIVVDDVEGEGDA